MDRRDLQVDIVYDGISKTICTCAQGTWCVGELWTVKANKSLHTQQYCTVWEVVMYN